MICISDLETVMSKSEARGTMQMLRKRSPDCVVKMVKSSISGRLVFKTFVSKSDVALAFKNVLNDKHGNCVRHREKWVKRFNKVKEIL